MLAYLLALVVGLGSLALYMAAFFFPEVHRKYDLIWSGVAMFYALVLWVCAGRVTGGVLLGQIASVALLGWFSWQTLVLRRAQTPIDLQTQLPLSARTPAEVARETLAQLQESFRQSAGKNSFSEAAERLIRQTIDLSLRLRDWFTAMITTMSTPLSAPVPPAEPESPAPDASAPDASRVSVVSVPPTAPAAASPAPASADAVSEVKVEWSDLELEYHPELDTIDGADGTFPVKMPPLTPDMPPAEPSPTDPNLVEPKIDPNLREH